MHSSIRKAARTMDAPTREFVNGVYEAIQAATDMTGHRAIAAFRDIATKVEARDVAEFVREPGQVTLTEDQWNRIARDARLMASTSHEEW